MDIWFWLGFLLAFGMGLGCGSYATMPYYRLPNGIPSAGKWLGKKSFCPSCNVQLRTRDLVPVFNRLWHRGKCFNCGAPIPLTYWLIEFFCTVLSVFFYIKHGFTEYYLVDYAVSVCLVILTATEMRYRSIPRQLLIVMLLFGLLRLDIAQIFDVVMCFFALLMVSLGMIRSWEKRYDQTLQDFGVWQLFCLLPVWGVGLPLAISITTSLILAILIHFLPFTADKRKPYGLAVVAGYLVRILIYS
jgi:prepilin signal peptidase PulO-like enzyme (type II secretory pathway)